MGWTHLVFAATVYLLFRRFGFYSGFDLPFAALLLGSVFPDIDHPRGLVSQMNLFRDFSRVLRTAVTHRGFMHSFFAALVFLVLGVGVTLYFGLGVYIALGFFFGYLLHLVADSLNPSGIRWLQPMRSRRVRWVISTGSFFEKILFFGLVVLSIYLLLY
jgi:inner membrane protein